VGAGRIGPVLPKSGNPADLRRLQHGEHLVASGFGERMWGRHVANLWSFGPEGKCRRL
jgi:hypothetical protein